MWGRGWGRIPLGGRTIREIAIILLIYLLFNRSIIDICSRWLLVAAFSDSLFFLSSPAVMTNWAKNAALFKKKEPTRVSL